MSKDNRDLIRLMDDISISSSQTSFNEFFNHFCSRLYAFAFQITGDKFMSEEVVSDVFTKLWKNRKSLTAIENIEAYLYKAVRNQSLTALRNCSKGLTYTQITPEVFITNCSPETSLLDAELEKLIRDTIEDMPRAQQMVFRLVKNDGLKYREVAQVLDISISTVENQMVRALRKLRHSIETYRKNSHPGFIRRIN